MYLVFTFIFISIHAPTRGATFVVRHFAFVIAISIHAPTRGATAFHQVLSSIPDNFNPRSHERSDINDLVNSIHTLIFQSTLPREERHVDPVITTTICHFNPRSHERSDRQGAIEGKGNIISIHAPTRGATLTSCVPSLYPKFQSTLPREERLFTSQPFLYK